MDIFKYWEATFLDPETESNYGYISSLKYAAPIHTHDFYEVFLITKGSTLHNVNNGVQHLKTGSLVFIRPSDVHYYDYDGNNDCEFINIPYGSKAISEAFTFLGKAFDAKRLLTSQMPPVSQLSPMEKENLTKRFEKLQLSLQSNKALITIQLRSFIVEVFSQYFSSIDSSTNTDYPLWFESLLTLMQKRDNFTVGLPRMYKLSGRSICHLNRTFKQYLNTTPTAYINSLRLNYTKYLLLTTNLTIIEISMDSGFENLSHFYHLFKKYYGMSPLELRRTWHRDEVIVAK